MENLSAEVLHLIVFELVGDALGMCLKDIWDLKSLRLCNRTLAVIAAEYLFRCVDLYFDEASYLRLQNIAMHPFLRKHVRRLSVMSKPHHGPLLDRIIFERWLRGEETIVNDYQHIPSTTTFPDIPESFDLSPAVVDHHYQQYSLSYEAQKDLDLFAEGILRNALSWLMNLREIHARLYHVDGLDEIEDRPESDIITYEIESSLQLECLDKEHALMVLRVIEYHRLLTGAEINLSQMFGCFDTAIFDLYNPVDRSMVHKLAKGIKRFGLTIMSVDVDILRVLLHAGKLSDFLGSLPQIEAFDCSTDYGYYSYTEGITPSIFAIFGQHQWTFLTELSLRCFFAASGELRDLFRRHKNVLRHVSLRSILLIEGGSWRIILNELAEGALERIEVFHLSNENTRWRNFEQGAVSGNAVDFFQEQMESDIESSDLEPTHPLHKFLIQGQKWDPNTAAVLLKEQQVVV